MPDPLCKPCQARGREVRATRIVPEAGWKIPKCDSCWLHNVPVDLSDAERARLAPIGRDHPETHHGSAGRGQEAVMPDEKCKCGRDVHHRGRCWARRGESGPPTAQGGLPEKRGRRQEPLTVNREAHRLRVKAEEFLRQEKGAIPGGGQFAAQIRVVPIEEFPGGLRGQNDAEYQALFLKLSRDCGENQGVASRIPAAAKKCKKVAGAVRSALRRLAAAHGLRWRLICRIDGETVYVGRVKK